MSAKQNLYELLGVGEHASTEQVRDAFRHKSEELQANPAGLSAPELNDQLQILKLALTTLTDPITRQAYDSKLRAQANTRALVLGGSPASSAAHADALALRADALALRADAMLLRSGADTLGGGRNGFWQSAGAGFLQRFANAIGLLVIVAVLAVVAGRFFFGGVSNQMAVESRQNKAAEQAALQEYYQTHGVRPANMAELELMEANRRRQEIDQRQARQDDDKKERDLKRFEEESRRRGEEVTRNLEMSEARAKFEAQVEAERESRDAARKQQLELMKQAEERRRQQENERQWREIIRR